jgi:transposase
MEVVHERCAGIDVSKKDAKVCVRSPGKRPGSYQRTVTTYGSTFNEIARLRADLERAQVSVVVMESTGDYWRPFFFGLTETLDVELVNARQVKHMPGRKSDVSDAGWLAELAAHGLLRASFVPPEAIRDLRDLTRTRKHVAEERTREFSRLGNELEGAGIKLAAVASSMTTKSVRAILDAMVAGEHDPRTLAGLAHANMRGKTGALIEALTGRFTDHHAFMTKFHLDRIDQLDDAIAALDARIDEVIAPFQLARELLTTIPGISTTVAEVVIAEIGVDMSVFATPKQLASWAGVCPTQNESAGKVKDTKTTHGNHYLKAALGIAALAVIRSKKSYLSTRYRRLVARRGKQKALVAIEHTMIVVIWNMLTNGTPFDELGPDYYDRLNPEHARNRAIRQLHTLGYEVQLTPTQVA